jgi:putative heme-binding domain-containing protein
MQRLIALFTFWFLLSPAFTQTQEKVRGAAPQFEFKDGDRVVFLGDTWMEREQQQGYIESRIISRLPGTKIIFRNLAWSADSLLGESRASFDPPEKGFDRLKEQLEAIKPTVVFLGYGMAESFKGADGIEKFKQDLGKLIDTINEITKAEPARFVAITPLHHENLGGQLPNPDKHNEQLKLYANAIRQVASERKLWLIDLFTLTERFQSTKNAPKLTENGIHPTPSGFWYLATMIEQQLGFGQKMWRMGIGMKGDLRRGSNGIEISNYQTQNGKISFNGKDQWLVTEAPPGGVPRFPGSAALQAGGVPNGDYTLKIDGTVAAIGTAKEWNDGKLFAAGSAFDQVEELRKTIVRKNELFFHRWRPENQTYLFGFRKYEQGQNAKEIPMFDPLISEQEKKIFELAALKTRSYELSPTAPGDSEKLASKTRKSKPVPKNEFDATPLPHPSFELAEGIEATLFAENPDLAKPIQMNFDPQGRLWVASSEVYPQIQPGQVANDKILLLEDTDGDGKSDKTTIFAEGLLIPTGVLPGDGGVYVANSTELLFYKDTDGDGHADQKSVLLSGFGTEDTHHILHTLRWGHDGQLYMNQSIYIHSHVETPHGVVRLRSGGVWNFRPGTWELGVHMKGLINSWGHHFDRYGQSFVTDGAGGEGINWVIPQAMFVTYEGARRILGSVSPGSYPKFCGLEVIESEHFPQDWQGTMVTCDFRAHRVVRFAIDDQGAGYITKELPDVMRSTNVTFRPIDVKLGPDGAIYIADWSNPIIQHGEVDFRDPRRDHEHGRIWKLTYKGRKLLPKQDLPHSSNSELLENLHSPNTETRQQSRRVLTERGPKIKNDLESWTAKQQDDQGKLEALWIYQSLDIVNPELLKRVLAAKDPNVRAAATRVLSFWEQRLDSPSELLAAAVKDEHPRVRVEAVRALSKIPTAKSADLVLGAVNSPMDRFLDYAVWLSINDLAEPWVKAIQDGTWKTEGREKELEFGLKAIEPQIASRVLDKVLADRPIPQDGSGPWLDLIASAGSQSQLTKLLDGAVAGSFSEPGQVKALRALSEALRLRKAAPEKNQQEIRKFFSSSNPDLKAAALRLAGQWKLNQFSPELLQEAGKAASPTIRDASFQSLRELGGASVVQGLQKLAAKDNEITTRSEAVKALAALDLNKAAPLAIEVLSDTPKEDQALALWRSLLSVKGAAPVFAQALPKSGLPEPVVKSGLRAAREGGRNEPNLVLALSRNIDQGNDAKTFSPEELKSLLAFIKEKGDPARGEQIYRRTELGCTSCHSIGGVGGKVGPDMTSIGASAQLDYLVESIQFPNRKVKEGFHAIMLETKDGQELSGILVRETDDQVMIRDATNREVSVAKSNIQKRTIGGSLMPAGLVDTLNENDQADLYRFLSELGKPGPYDASKGNVARTWRLMPRILDLAQFDDAKVVTMDQSNWSPAYTLVDGRLLKSELDASLKRLNYRNPDAIYASTRFELSKAGPVHIQLPDLKGAGCWIDGKQVQATTEIVTDLPAGAHSLSLKLPASALPEFLKASTPDATFVNN